MKTNIFCILFYTLCILFLDNPLKCQVKITYADTRQIYFHSQRYWPFEEKYDQIINPLIEVFPIISPDEKYIVSIMGSRRSIEKVYTLIISDINTFTKTKKIPVGSARKDGEPYHLTISKDSKKILIYYIHTGGTGTKYSASLLDIITGKLIPLPEITGLYFTFNNFEGYKNIKSVWGSDTLIYFYNREFTGASSLNLSTLEYKMLFNKQYNYSKAEFYSTKIKELIPKNRGKSHFLISNNSLFISNENDTFKRLIKKIEGNSGNFQYTSDLNTVIIDNIIINLTVKEISRISYKVDINKFKMNDSEIKKIHEFISNGINIYCDIYSPKINPLNNTTTGPDKSERNSIKGKAKLYCIEQNYLLITVTEEYKPILNGDIVNEIRSDYNSKNDIIRLSSNSWSILE